VEHTAAPVEHKAPTLEHKAAPVEHNAAAVEHMHAPVEHIAAPAEHKAHTLEHKAAPVEHNAAPVQHNAAPLPGMVCSSTCSHRCTAAKEVDSLCLQAVETCSRHAFESALPVGFKFGHLSLDKGVTKR
jgi:hypothetical protein